jgi:hypothetical protein
MSSKDELFRLEDAAWAPLHELSHEVTPDEGGEPGYYEEGWSAKDLLAHMACWYAEAAQALLQIRLGTYRHEEEDEDEVNRRFLEACRGLSHSDVLAQLHASRTRMLEELDLLPQSRVDGEAERWFRDSGIDPDKVNKDRVGVLVGTGIGGMKTFYDQSVSYHQHGPRGVSPFFIPMLIPDMPAGHISIK